MARTNDKMKSVPSTIRYCMFTDQASPSIAFLEDLITVSRVGSITGNPSIATSDGFPPALDAIADMRVRIDERHAVPKKAEIKNIGMS